MQRRNSSSGSVEVLLYLQIDCWLRIRFGWYQFNVIKVYYSRCITTLCPQAHWMCILRSHKDPFYRPIRSQCIGKHSSNRIDAGESLQSRKCPGSKRCQSTLKTMLIMTIPSSNLPSNHHPPTTSHNAFHFSGSSTNRPSPLIQSSITSRTLLKPLAAPFVCTKRAMDKPTLRPCSSTTKSSIRKLTGLMSNAFCFSTRAVIVFVSREYWTSLTP